MSRTELIGQEAFEGMQPPRDLGSLNAFARAATPEYWGMTVDHYHDVTGIMLRAAAPEKLRPNLIDVRQRAPLTVAYEDEQTGRYRYVPLLPEEYTLVPRTMSAGRYGEVVVAQTLAGKGSLRYADDELRSRGDEHGNDAIRAKLEKIEAYLADTLVPRSELLARLQEAAAHPGFWRMKEGDMRMAMEQVRSFMIPDALRVIGNARQWSKDQAKMASRAVEYRLFFDRKRNQHIANWQGMLGLLQDYQQEKINLFADRRGRFEGYLHQHKVK